jgi:hypothetical protein
MGRDAANPLRTTKRHLMDGQRTGPPTTRTQAPRTRRDTICPDTPRLVTLLLHHIREYKTAPGGRIFIGSRGGILTDRAYLAVFHDARAAAFTRHEAESLLARRPYDLRHATVSTWLNAGVAPPQVAEWAGHSVDVLLRVYASASPASRTKPSAGPSPPPNEHKCPNSPQPPPPNGIRPAFLPWFASGGRGWSLSRRPPPDTGSHRPSGVGQRKGGPLHTSAGPSDGG